MNKLLKLRINRIRKEGSTHYEYPTPYYEASKVKFGPIYEGSLDEVVKGDIESRNLNDEYILVGINDSDLDQFMKINNYSLDGFQFSAQEIDRDEAVKCGNKWTNPQQQTDKITDQDKVIKILAKVARREELTDEEIASIDPNNRGVLGISRSKNFEETLDDFLNQK